MKELSQLGVAMVGLVYLVLSIGGDVVSAKEALQEKEESYSTESYVDKLYEKEGKTYLDVTLETTDTTHKTKEPFSLEEFNAYWIANLTSDAPKDYSDKCFVTDVHNVLKYLAVVAEYEDVKALEGGNAVEKEVIAEVQAEKFRDVLNAREKYGKEICSVPKDVIINLSTVDISTDKSTQEDCEDHTADVVVVIGVFLLLFLIAQGLARQPKKPKD